VEQLKTEMYAGSGSREEHGRAGEEVDSSMDLGSGESELGGFRERKDRLERAARLLNEGSGEKG